MRTYASWPSTGVIITGGTSSQAGPKALNVFERHSSPRVKERQFLLPFQRLQRHRIGDPRLERTEPPRLSELLRRFQVRLAQIPGRHVAFRVPAAAPSVMTRASPEAGEEFGTDIQKHLGRTTLIEECVTPPLACSSQLLTPRCVCGLGATCHRSSRRHQSLPHTWPRTLHTL